MGRSSLFFKAAESVGNGLRAVPKCNEADIPKRNVRNFI